MGDQQVMGMTIDKDGVLDGSRRKTSQTSSTGVRWLKEHDNTQTDMTVYDQQSVLTFNCSLARGDLYIIVRRYTAVIYYAI